MLSLSKTFVFCASAIAKQGVQPPLAYLRYSSSSGLSCFSINICCFVCFFWFACCLACDRPLHFLHVFKPSIQRERYSFTQLLMKIRPHNLVSQAYFNLHALFNFILRAHPLYNGTIWRIKCGSSTALAIITWSSCDILKKQNRLLAKLACWWDFIKILKAVILSFSYLSLNSEDGWLLLYIRTETKN